MNDNKKIHVKTGDTVVVISGESFTKRNFAKDGKLLGKVKAVSPKEGKIIVEGVSIGSKHVKPRKQGDPGGIIKTERAIYASKVMLHCPNPKCPSANKNTGVRVRSKLTEKGEKIRVCAKCGESI